MASKRLVLAGTSQWKNWKLSDLVRESKANPEIASRVRSLMQTKKRRYLKKAEYVAMFQQHFKQPVGQESRKEEKKAEEHKSWTPFLRDLRDETAEWLKMIGAAPVPTREYPLDQKEIDRYIEAIEKCGTYARIPRGFSADMARRILGNTRYVSWAEFIARVHEMAENLAKRLAGSPWVTWLGILGHFGQDTDWQLKSNFWVFRLVYDYFLHNRPNLAHNFVAVLTTRGKKDLHPDLASIPVVLFDDALYSGGQFQELRLQASRIFDLSNVLAFVPYYSSRASRGDPIEGSERISAIDLSDALRLTRKPRTEGYRSDPEDWAAAAQEQTAEPFDGKNKFPIYFAHKVADIVSTFPDVYVGHVQCRYKGPVQKFEIVSGCKDAFQNISENLADQQKSLNKMPCPPTPYKLPHPEWPLPPQQPRTFVH